MFIWVFHIYSSAQSQNQTLRWSSSLNCISHLDEPSSCPNLFSAWSALNIYQELHSFGDAEGFVGSGSSTDFLVCHHSNLLCLLLLLLPFCKWGKCGPHIHFSSTGLLFIGFGKAIAWGIVATLGRTSAFSTFTVGVCIGGFGHLPWLWIDSWRLVWC